jgi:CRP-like cAMP-binding protein
MTMPPEISNDSITVSREDQTLAHVTIFADLDREAQREIEGMVKWHRVSAGQVIFDQETDQLEVYFVVSGSVRILTTVEDREVTLAEITAGNVFGEIASIDRMPRSAKAVADKDSVLASLEGPTFVSLMLRYPSIALHIVYRMARVIRTLDKRVTSLSTMTDEQRVVIELLRLAEPDPKIPNSWYIRTMPVHSEIAGWAGTSRETVAQTIGKLARDGIVKRRGTELVICDWLQLQFLGKVASARD